MRYIWLTLVVVVAALGCLTAPRGEQAAGQVAFADSEKGEGDLGPGDGEPTFAHGKPILAIDPGVHVDRVCSYDITPDGKKLITLSLDNTIQVWDAATRERLKILRLPLHAGANAKLVGIVNDFSFVLVAPDGKTLVIKTNFRKQIKEKKWTVGEWYLVHLETGRIIRFAGLPIGQNVQLMPIFAADGDTLAVRGHFKGKGHPIPVWIMRGFKNVWQPEAPAVTVWKELAWKPGYNDIHFSPDSSKLIGCAKFLASKAVFVTAWNLTKETKGNTQDFKTTLSHPLGLSWSPKGTRLAVVTAKHFDQSALDRCLDVWTAENLLLRSKTFDAATTGTLMMTPFFRNDNEVLIVGTSLGDKNRPAVLRYDVQKDRVDEVVRFTPPADLRTGKFTADGQRLVMSGGRDILMTRKELKVEKGKTGKKNKKDEPVADDADDNENSDISEISVLDLQPKAQVQPLYTMQAAPKLAFSKQGYKLAWTGNDDGKLSAGLDLESGEFLLPADVKAEEFSVPATTAILGKEGAKAPEYSATPRYANGGLIDIFAHRKKAAAKKIVFTVYAAGQDWVICTPEGYYAASPGGERMVGWHVNNGPNQAASFYPFERFRKQLYRPDVIAMVLKRGSVAEALKVADALRGQETAAVQLDDQLPPRAVLTVLDQSKLPAVTLKVRAEASSKKQLVTALRLLVDGRPLPEGAAHKKFDQGQEKAEAEWSITLPPGKHQLTVLARCPDSSSKSNTVEVAVADPSKQNVLHVLAIGVSDYEERTLKLDFAAKDAGDIAANFVKCCKGELFTEVHGETLVNAKARKDAILKQLAELRKQARPNDLVVVFFAGHGVKEDAQFYLLTVEANPGDLAKTALSGADLRKALGEFPCQVLLMLDACHSSESLKNFRSAVDDLTRNLTDDECGVAVLCAAMAHEKALEKGGNGLFTKAIVDGLNRGEGVPFNTVSRLFYVHHLHSYVFDRVSDQSGGRQHPFLSLPWVVESFPVTQFGTK